MIELICYWENIGRSRQANVIVEIKCHLVQMTLLSLTQIDDHIMIVWILIRLTSFPFLLANNLKFLIRWSLVCTKNCNPRPFFHSRDQLFNLIAYQFNVINDKKTINLTDKSLFIVLLKMNFQKFNLYNLYIMNVSLYLWSGIIYIIIR